MKRLLPIITVLSALVAISRAQLPPSALIPQRQTATATMIEAPPTFQPKVIEPQTTATGGATGTFQARGIGFGKLTLQNWQASWGSYDRDYERQHHVEVILSAWGKGKTEAELQTLWFGRELKPQGKRVILNWTTLPITLVGGTGPRSIMCHSGKVVGSKQNYIALGERYGDGHKIEGWYVRLKDTEGNVLHDAASATFLADIGRNPQEVAKLEDLTASRR